MIEYDTKRWAQIVFRVHGSVLPRIAWRVLAVVLVAAVLTFGALALDWHVPTSKTLHAIVGVA